MPQPIYLDHNATTPHAPEVIAAMRPFLETHFGNPSSAHPYGIDARKAVERARGQVARLIGSRPDEIVFTSGGTESNNHAIRGIARAARERGDHVVTTSIEHPAVVEVCRFIERSGGRVTTVPVDGRGRVDPDDVARAITSRTILVSVMHANNEIGTIQPVAEIAEIARSRGIAFHTDAAQSIGKIPVDVAAIGADLLAIAGHKLGAPKGIGAIYVRRGIALDRLMMGAGQEQGRRPGTENVMHIVGLGAACELASRDPGAHAAHLARTRDRLLAGLADAFPGAVRNGDADACLPNTLSVAIPGVDAALLLTAVADRVAASAGAACHAGDMRISPVLRAIRLPPDLARATIRFSTGRTTTDRDIDTAVAALATTARARR